MPNRREFIAGSAAFAFFPFVPRETSAAPVYVNDIQSQLNRTRVANVLVPRSSEELQAAIRSARSARKAISIAGGRHAMGGQQFGTDSFLLDTRGMDRILRFDKERGLIEVEAGIQWPKLIDGYLK